MTLIIDNYDSFTFNLYQMIEALGQECRVVRNDKISLAEIAELRPDNLVLSPGPGDPTSAGITLSAIGHFAKKYPILGVCLGHQAIGQFFGGRVVRARRAMHGKSSKMIHKGLGIFSGIEGPMRAARYHSLIVERATLPDSLEVTCETEDGLIMGLRHRELRVEGVQFHPESFATEGGQKLMQNFLKNRAQHD